jgi:NTP pyrophosphatase (non-canonical NTP hydrolase)
MTRAEKQDIVRQLVAYEYNHACAKHPGFDHSYEKAVCILTEEVGGVAQAINDKDLPGMIREVAQVAAVCERFLEMVIE